MGLINSPKGSYAARHEAAAKALAEQRRRKDEEWDRSRRYLAEARAELEKAMKEKKPDPAANQERAARAKATIEYSKRLREEAGKGDTRKHKGKI